MKARKINPFVVGYILGLGFLAFLGYAVGDFTAEMQQAKHQALITNPNFATDVSFVDLPRMNLTIASAAGSSGRIRIDMTLEVEKKNLARFEDYQPIITDHLISFVRQMDAEDMHKPNAAPTLRKELLKEVNRVAFPVPVLDVVFRQFLVM
jgi:flagellar basal body-associated protein FliL